MMKNGYGSRELLTTLCLGLVTFPRTAPLPHRDWYFSMFSYPSMFLGESQWRSGGFPKFPGSSAECGTRTVPHQPSRGSSTGASAKIVGGSSTPYGAYPWQVEIQAYSTKKRGYDHHCGGAVVGDLLVLTAAHCVTNLDRPDHLRLVVGKHSLRGKDQHERAYRPQRIIVHPEFRIDGPHSNDIALIKVKASSETGIDFNQFVQPICLPETDIGFSEGAWCTVTGWGAQKPGDSKSLSPTLRAASVPLLSQSTCRQRDVYGGRDQNILDTMLCAGLLEGGVDACEGDSGGPLACQQDGRFVLAGVVSWGDGCAKRNRPGVYTRVAAFTPWIQSTMNRLGLR